MLLQSVQLAVKVISNACTRAGISNLDNVVDGSSQFLGDTAKKLDVFSHDVFVNCLTYSKQVYIMGSEENDEPLILHDSKGGYAIVFDPLDGSSNIDANVSVGTIFGIYQKDAKEENKKPSTDDLLKTGDKLICAGYALYGASTMLVLSTGNGVNGFLLDPSLGEFILTHENIRVPKKGNIYSINEGSRASWDPAILHCVKSWQEGARPLKARYIGSMVADVHRTLLYGGIFCYPATANSRDGKLRLLYEGNPMAFIIEKAGGRASTGYGRVLEVVPTSLHCSSPIFLGSPGIVQQVEQAYAKFLPLPPPPAEKPSDKGGDKAAPSSEKQKAPVKAKL